MDTVLKLALAEFIKYAETHPDQMRVLIQQLLELAVEEAQKAIAAAKTAPKAAPANA